jgi:hypothetical protein
MRGAVGSRRLYVCEVGSKKWGNSSEEFYLDIFAFEIKL